LKIKLDENLPTGLAHLLTNLGHDVDTVPDEGWRVRKTIPCFVPRRTPGDS
jgi:hypothetical protein